MNPQLRLNLRLRFVQAFVLPFVALAITFLSLAPWFSVEAMMTWMARSWMLAWPESAVAAYFVSALFVMFAISMGLAVLLTRKYIMPILQSTHPDQVVETLLQGFLPEDP